MISGWEMVLVALAAALAGAVNALAGGGTLITFPVLMAVGVPAVVANVTNTVALAPGYLGAAFGQARDLEGQRARLRVLLPISAVGGIVGGLILLRTAEQTFRTLVPFLILLAAALLALQEPVRRWIARRSGPARGREPTRTPGTARNSDRNDRTGNGSESARRPRAAATHASVVLATGVAAVYGGYFGAGLSVIVLAMLGLTVDDSLTRLNALKQAVAFAANTAAAILFVFSGRTLWGIALVMAIGAVIGGVLGGRLASRIRPETLRLAVVVIGAAVGIAYLIR